MKMSYKDKEIWILKMGNFFQDTYKRIGKEIPICPVCNKEIDNNCSYLLCSNNEIFPNLVVHEKCIDKIDFDKIKEIEGNYDLLKNLSKIFK